MGFWLGSGIRVRAADVHPAAVAASLGVEPADAQLILGDEVVAAALRRLRRALGLAARAPGLGPLHPVHGSHLFRRLGVELPRWNAALGARRELPLGGLRGGGGEEESGAGVGAPAVVRLAQGLERTLHLPEGSGVTALVWVCLERRLEVGTPVSKERPRWLRSARATDWPRLVGTWGSLRHALAPHAASGAPAEPAHVRHRGALYGRPLRVEVVASGERSKRQAQLGQAPLDRGRHVRGVLLCEGGKGVGAESG